jgi:hypothetical protein
VDHSAKTGERLLLLWRRLWLDQVGKREQSSADFSGGRETVIGVSRLNAAEWLSCAYNLRRPVRL